MMHIVLSIDATHVVIPLSSHAERLLKTSKSGVTDVGTVKEREKVEKSQEGEKSPIHLAEETLGGIGVKDLIGVILVEGNGVFVVDLFDR